MAKTKISALTTLADGSIAIGDLIPIVDIDDFSQAASGTTKKVTITSLASAVATAFSGDSPTFVNLNTTGTTTLGDSGDATTVNGTLGVTGVSTLAAVNSGAIVSTGNITAGNGGYFRITNPNGSGNYPSTSGELKFYSDQTDARWSSILGYRNSYGDQAGLKFYTLYGAVQTLALTLDPFGDATFAGTLGVTGVATFTDNIAMASGKGIDFSANANASGMTSELLNDYESGTWTPTQGAGLTLSGTFSSSGTYVKIGNVVYVNGFVGGTTSVSVATADTALCSALPFTAAASTNHTALGLNSATNASIPLQITNTTVYAAGTMAATIKIHFSGTYHI